MLDFDRFIPPLETTVPLLAVDVDAHSDIACFAAAVMVASSSSSFPSKGASPGCTASRYMVMGTRIGQLRTEIPRRRYTNFHKSCKTQHRIEPNRTERMDGSMDRWMMAWWWVESCDQTVFLGAVRLRRQCGGGQNQ